MSSPRLYSGSLWKLPFFVATEKAQEHRHAPAAHENVGWRLLPLRSRFERVVVPRSYLGNQVEDGDLLDHTRLGISEQELLSP